MGAEAGEENWVCSGRNPKTAALSEQRERKVLGRAGGKSSLQQPLWFGRDCFKHLMLLFKEAL